jgi:hypothetical protein
MTAYSADHILKLERMLDRMARATVSLSDSPEQVQMVQDIQFIMAEVRMCSQTLDLPDEVTRPDSLKSKAVDRLLGIFDTYK